MGLNFARALAVFVFIVVTTELLAFGLGLHAIVFSSFPLAESVAVSLALGLVGAFMLAGGGWRLALKLLFVTIFLLFGLVVFLQDQVGLLSLTSLGDPIVVQSIGASVGFFLGLEAMRRNRWWVLAAAWG